MEDLCFCWCHAKERIERSQLFGKRKFEGSSWDFGESDWDLWSLDHPEAFFWQVRATHGGQFKPLGKNVKPSRTP